MSLINEALKKAQRQRSLDNAPLSSAPSGVAAAAVTTHVRAASHRRSNAPIYFGLGLLALGVVSTVLIMRYGFTTDTPAPVSTAQANTAPGISVSVAPVIPVATETSIPSTLTTATVAMPPITSTSKAPTDAAHALPPKPAAAPEPQEAAAVPAPPASAAPSAPLSTPPPAPVVVASVPPASPPKPAGPTDADREARAQAFISTLRLTGVRGVDAQARVLMNEKVYRLNDTVEPAIPLRLSAVRPGLLVFTDGKGRTYERTY